MTEIKSQLHFDRYIKFINSRPTRLKKTKDLYTERHHIIPRSLGGSNDKDNLILLTGREHFIAHLILWKAFGGKAAHAFSIMQTFSPDHQGKRYFKLTSRQFEQLRIDFAKSVSESKKGKPPWNKGRKQTKEEKAKIAAIYKEKGITPGPKKGSKQSNESREKRKATMKKNGTEPWNINSKMTEKEKEHARQTRLKNGTKNGKKGPKSKETREKEYKTKERNGTLSNGGFKKGTKRWVNDGLTNKAISKVDPLPDGWLEGSFKKI